MRQTVEMMTDYLLALGHSLEKICLFHSCQISYQQLIDFRYFLSEFLPHEQRGRNRPRYVYS